MTKITQEQECLLNEIEEAVAAFRRDGELLCQTRSQPNSDWLITSSPAFNFYKYKYKPVPKPKFKWPEGLNATAIRINKDRWLELYFHGSPTIAVPLNTLKANIIAAMEVDKIYQNPDGQEPPVKS